MDERQQRIVRNEALFREVNERIGQIADTSETEFLCECGNVECASPIRMTLSDYERVRADGHRFAVIPSHELTEIEKVVERRDGYLVVEKLAGGPAELAKATDPRA
jgi:hypothetical protein